MDPQAQPVDELKALFLKLAHDKRYRPMVARGIKEIAPDSPHAAAFADVEVEEKFEAWKREQEEKDLKRQQDEILSSMNRKRAALLAGDKGRKYSEDDLKKIEDLMQKKGISDYDDGATLYAATLPPVDPKPSNEPPQHGATWEMPEFAKFGADPNKAARDTAHSIISDFMRKR